MKKARNKAVVTASPKMSQSTATGRVFTMYREEIVDEICSRLAMGDSLRKICGEDNPGADPNMPDMKTVTLWLGRYEEFRLRYARAREIQSEVLMDQIVDIADDTQNDFVEMPDKYGNLVPVFNREHVERSKLRVHARQWAVSKLYARKYGERTLIEHTGAVGSFDLTKMATDDLEQLERILAGATPSEGDQQ